MKHKTPIITPRLILRPPTAADLDVMQAAKEDVWHDLQCWMSWSYDINKGRDPLATWIATAENYEDKPSLPLIAIDPESGDFVLSTGVDALADKPGCYATGYWAKKEWKGKGLATEATNAVIRYAFDHLGAKEMHICHYEGNEASRRVIEKLGFTPAGIRPKAHNRCLDDIPLDVHDYIMIDPAVLPPLKIAIG